MRSGARQPVRHAAPRRRARHGHRCRDRHRRRRRSRRAGVAARRRASAVGAEGAGAAQRAQGRRQAVVAREGGLGYGAENGQRAALPGNRLGRQRCRSRETAGPDVLARRRRPADHLGPDGHAWAEQDPAEPRYLSPAGDRPQQADHALARASRRRARFSRIRAAESRQALSGRRRPRRRSGDDPRRRHAGAPIRCPNTSSPACCAAAARNWRSA